jgi:hypothetical protein
VDEVKLQIQRRENELENVQKWLADCNAEKAALEDKKAKLERDLKECEKKCNELPAMDQPVTPAAPECNFAALLCRQ